VISILCQFLISLLSLLCYHYFCPNRWNRSSRDNHRSWQIYYVCLWFTSHAICFRWRASIYKLVWLDLTLFLFIYYSLSSIYRLLLNEEQKRIFEAVVAYCNEYSDLIPLSFVLGFFVSIVMTRWWNQYMAIPWPDSIAVFVSATIHGNDERGRLMRRTIVRYFVQCKVSSVLSKFLGVESHSKEWKYCQSELEWNFERYMWYSLKFLE